MHSCHQSILFTAYKLSMKMPEAKKLIEKEIEKEWPNLSEDIKMKINELKSERGE